jgi:3-oxoacyl-[acyl-carrier-protein] synthase II
MARKSRRVVITGLGVVANCGIGLEAFWTGLCSKPPEGDRRVTDFDPANWYDNPKEVRRADRFQQFAEAAAHMAVKDAGGLHAEPARAGIVFATGVGGMVSYETQMRLFHEHGPRHVSPFLVPMMMPNGAGAAISLRHDLRGPSETITTACAGGTQAVGNAARIIMHGRCDLMITGGSEAPMSELGFVGFRNLRALSKTGRSMPFDRERDGFLLAEGAAVLVLEELELARRRGARIYAEVLGSASNADAFHLTAPREDGSGAADCMRLAMEDAGLEPSDIVHINAHGTSTPLNDAAEARAIDTVFGSLRPAVMSIKGITGHTLAAAGAIEAAALALSCHRRALPPTAGLENPDPELPALDYVMGARDWEPGPSISNSFGFGGHNGCLVMGPYRAE